jgi:hypothetical protein
MQQPQFPNSAIRLKFDFKFVPVAESQSLQRLEEAALKESSFLSFFKKKKKRQIRGELGVPEQAQYQLRLHLYQARQLVAADASGLSDPYVVRAFPFPPSLLRPGPRQAKPSCGADCAPVRQEGQERRQARDSQPGVVSDVPRQCGAAQSRDGPPFSCHSGARSRSSSRAVSSYDFDKFSGDDPLGRMHMAVSKVFKVRCAVRS